MGTFFIDTVKANIKLLLQNSKISILDTAHSAECPELVSYLLPVLFFTQKNDSELKVRGS